MTSIKNRFARISTTLVSAVADDATFTVPYPTGFAQLSFTKGMARTGGYMIVNGNDRWAQADPGFSVAYGASLITVTNLTGASLPAGATIDINLDVADGNGRIPITLAPLPLAGVTAADVITECYPGIAGTIEYWEFHTTVAVTTAARLATFNLEIDTTNVTGSLALTSALLTPKGTVIGAECTANNVLTRESKLSLEASAVTAFAEGEGYFVVYIRPTGDDVY